MLSLTFLGLKACGYSPKKETSEKTLNINIKGEPPSLDPRKGGDLVSSSMYFILFEGLMRQNPDGSTTPAIAEKVKVSSDGCTYTFTLRNAHWSNGDLVTSKDFEASWKKILDPHFPSFNAHLLYPIKNAKNIKKGLQPIDSLGVYCPNPRVLIVELEESTPYFLELVSFCAFFPVHHKIDLQDPDWAYNYSPHFVTNGPFKLKEWKHNNYIICEKNPFYWESDQVGLQQIYITMIEDELTVLNMYEKGLLDIAGMPLSPLPTDSVTHLKENGLLHITPIAGEAICAFNTEELPFSNLNLRKAFSLSIDRSAIANNITALDQAPSSMMLPPPLSSERAPLISVTHLEQAKEYLNKGLEETGFTLNELEKMLVYTYGAADFNQRVAQTLQQQWKSNLGVNVSLQALEQKTFLTALKTRQFKMAQTVLIAQYNDPMSILERFLEKDTAKNYSGWENSEFQMCISQSKLYPQYSLKRRFALSHAEEILAQEIPYTPLYNMAFSMLIKPYVKRVYFTPIGGLYFNYLQIDENLKKDYLKHRNEYSLISPSH